MSSNLLILGASVRAAAQSARRAGFAPAGVDLFADVDLAKCGPAVRVEDYPAGLAEAAADWPGLSWMYTGALENHPDVIGRISRDRPLWGNSEAIVSRVRDPWQLHSMLSDSGIKSPELRRLADAPPRDGRWLRKAMRSAAGMHVEVWDGDSNAGNSPGGSFFQAYVPGTSVAAVFVGNGVSARLLGVSTQRSIGGGFQYTGSSTVVTRHDVIAEQFERIGEVLASEFRMVGLFGVDAVFDSEILWPVEVNPRYTASVEIHERAGEFDAVRFHRDACVHAKLPDAVRVPPRIHVGKTILYAQHDMTTSARFVDWTEQCNADRVWPRIADIPQIGTTITAGQPVTTLLVEAESATELDHREQQLHAEFDNALGSWTL